MPRGQVFFTGQADSKEAGKPGARKRSAAPAAGAGGGSTPSTRPGNNEEIVGTLDQGVGADRPKTSSKNKVSTNKRDENDFFEEDERAPTTKIKASTHYYSDSDSSADEESNAMPTKCCSDENEAAQPMSLPFPQQAEVTPKSFFGQEVGDNGWFLMQLPTRLLQFTKEEVEDVTDGKDDAEVEVLSGVETAPVSVKPVASGIFDNVLSKAPPGKFGKLRVYKSGRTELVLGDGVVLDVSEGLTCSFQQQAVAVDLDNARLVPMGRVKETFVATPNID